MVGAARLKRTGARLAALLAVVLLSHGVALRWLAHELVSPQALRTMPTPMFTRVLQQTAAPQAPAPLPLSKAAARPRTRHIEALPVPVVKARERVASQPVAVASSPPQVAAPLAPQPPAATEIARAANAASGPPSAEPIALALTAASAASAASSPATPGLDSWPVDTRLNYRLGGQFRSGELHGSARVQWLRQGGKYEAKIDIKVTLLASLVLTSQGELTPQGLFPRAYEEMRGSGPRTARMGDDNITLHDGRRLPRPPGVQDTASQFVELSHRFATGMETLEVGRSVSFWLARPGGVDLWTYDVVERETLRTPELGDVDAFHLKPRPIANPRGNITAEMWFAPSLQYLPVRIKVLMGEGTFVDLLVDKIEQR